MVKTLYQYHDNKKIMWLLWWVFY